MGQGTKGDCYLPTVGDRLFTAFIATTIFITSSKFSGELIFTIFCSIIKPELIRIGKTEYIVVQVLHRVTIDY